MIKVKKTTKTGLFLDYQNIKVVNRNDHRFHLYFHIFPNVKKKGKSEIVVWRARQTTIPVLTIFLTF